MEEEKKGQKGTEPYNKPTVVGGLVVFAFGIFMVAFPIFELLDKKDLMDRVTGWLVIFGGLYMLTVGVIMVSRAAGVVARPENDKSNDVGDEVANYFADKSATILVKVLGIVLKIVAVLVIIVLPFRFGFTGILIDVLIIYYCWTALTGNSIDD